VQKIKISVGEKKCYTYKDKLHNPFRAIPQVFFQLRMSLFIQSSKESKKIKIKNIFNLGLKTIHKQLHQLNFFLQYVWEQCFFR